MKKYVQTAKDIPNLKQMPTFNEFLDKYFVDMYGFDGNFSSNGFWNSCYLALCGDDIVDYEGAEDIAVIENGGKYLDEYLAMENSDDADAFCKTHPDVQITVINWVNFMFN